MRTSSSITITAILAVAATPSQAKERPPLPPSSAWNIHYADDSCRLVRTFGEGNEAVSILLESFEPGDWFNITFVGEPLKTNGRGAARSPLLRFGPNAEASEVDLFIGTHGELPALISQSTVRIVPLTEAEIEARDKAAKNGEDYDPPKVSERQKDAVEWLQLSRALAEDVKLETGSLMKPLAALDKCSWDLVRLWGLDPEQQKTLLRKPKRSRPERLFISHEDYPEKMIRDDRQGIVQARLLIDSDGKVSSCKNLIETEDKEFGEVVCRKLRSGKFEPALDAAGRPVPSYQVQRVTFRLE